MTADLALRLAAFCGAIGALLIWEAGAPRESRRMLRWPRWSTNFGLSLFGLALVRLTVGGLAFAAAHWARSRGWGLFNAWPVPSPIGAVLAFLFLDLGVYAQHVATHAWPPLWRLHRVHHSDLEMDVSTAVRFHPLEILLSMGYKSALVVLMGASPLAVLAFEVTLSLGALFTHANGRVPEALDRTLRWVFVTPAMHATHHSDKPFEANSNYGFSFSWWDRIFRTYQAQPEPGLVLGLRGVPHRGLWSLLLWPFKNRP